MGEKDTEEKETKEAGTSGVETICAEEMKKLVQQTSLYKRLIGEKEQDGD